jgi:hypothetical protein
MQDGERQGGGCLPATAVCYRMPFITTGRLTPAVARCMPALAWLPEPAELCRRYCEEAVAAYQDSTAPDWSFSFQAGSHAALAIARIGMGELDGASEAMACVFELPVPQRINPVIQSVRRVYSVLNCSPLAGGRPELAEKIKVFAGTHPARLSL